MRSQYVVAKLCGCRMYFNCIEAYGLLAYSVIFFFSSRKRHTRCLSDWSSDVCSSDLVGVDVQRRAFNRPVQPIAVPLVIARAERFAALDRVLELGLAVRQVDDVHFRVGRGVRPRDVE